MFWQGPFSVNQGKRKNPKKERVSISRLPTRVKAIFCQYFTNMKKLILTVMAQNLAVLLIMAVQS
jgi:hypothetical protein